MFAPKLNILAFIFIGLQIRPILESLEVADRGRYFALAGAVLLTVIFVRPAWHMSFNAVVRWRNRRFGFHPPRPMLQPTVGSGLIISWAGMRGIVSLAVAMALPTAFPYRDFIVLTSKRLAQTANCFFIRRDIPSHRYRCSGCALVALWNVIQS